ncbi:plasmid mobilization relaxosome protein MobC [Colwellia sp. 4_MG-2023]|uniref:plasmid mobilization relaxosome protein MobC n=1 Tax=unclassified Colwellia TaxID=196834 RepID=UPI0026E28991|nr:MULTISPECIES: plasmid mobilization relaxosome protein MobC [unclassified Colwellia]MDO6508754.1 plasmid mobilization relaxosome protein MobC [Colwellia sp. 5_MG-2023]MDO6557419.1 plasmid mobilization relaxosome protein MobC [Colwellia sp. 4_MG-2023]
MKEKREKIIKVRVNKDEFSEFKKRTNSNLSAFIRQLVLQQKVVKHVPRCDPSLIFEVAKIGANINQIARVLNYSKKSEIYFDVLKCTIELQNIDNKLKIIIENQQKNEE